MSRNRKNQIVDLAKQFVPGEIYNGVSNTPVNPKMPSQQQYNQDQLNSQQRGITQNQTVEDNKQVKELIGKQELNNVSINEESIVQSVNDSSIIRENEKFNLKKIFMNRKKPSVRAKEKRIRQNRRLRKDILPKNALMALNEVKGINISDFTINNNTSGGFSAIVTVNDIQYEGNGNSKTAAKNNACEKALRDFILAKMVQKPRVTKHQKNANEIVTMDTNDSDGGDSHNSIDDDVPMINLASFAIYKLFSEWENEGYIVPELHPMTSSVENGNLVPREPKKATIRNDLPSKWEEMHPATLLCMMRPGLSYNYCGSVGENPNVIQKATVKIDDQEFCGTGRSKKIARRNVAVNICNTMFGTNFTIEK